MKIFFKSLVRFYKVFLSPLFGGQCRFDPTCSSFALEALEVLPLGRALGRILQRVLSCHPWGSVS